MPNIEIKYLPPNDFVGVFNVPPLISMVKIANSASMSWWDRVDFSVQISKSTNLHQELYAKASEERSKRFDTWCGLDTHRWVVRLLNEWRRRDPENVVERVELESGERGYPDALKFGRFSERFFNEVVGPILEAHGDIFKKFDVNLTEEPRFQDAYAGSHELEEWLKRISELEDAGDGEKMNEYSSQIELPLASSYKWVAGDWEAYRIYISNQMLHLQANSILGWLWLLLKRDSLHGITYSKCEGCIRANKSELEIREVPSIGLDGEPVQFCGAYCRSR